MACCHPRNSTRVNIRASRDWTRRLLRSFPTTPIPLVAEWKLRLVGYGVPPLYGDFEVQRHWMELTLHVPLKEWYYHDKQWWGLDYPPLTAYVSLLFGKLYGILESERY